MWIDTRMAFTLSSSPDDNFNIIKLVMMSRIILPFDKLAINDTYFVLSVDESIMYSKVY